MRVLVHASNAVGIGAVQVVGSLLTPMLKRLASHETVLYLPREFDLSRIPPRSSCKTVQVSRKMKPTLKNWLPNAVSRMVECALPHRCFQGFDRCMVLGDIRLYGVNEQVVLVR